MVKSFRWAIVKTIGAVCVGVLVRADAHFYQNGVQVAPDAHLQQKRNFDTCIFIRHAENMWCKKGVPLGYSNNCLP
jgi:hypothetical protein